MPNFSVIAGPQGGDGHIGIWHVPIDDYAHWRWHSHCAVTRRSMQRAGCAATPVNTSRNSSSTQRGERYLQDRSTMNETYTGMGNNFNSHDAFATGSQGAIQDRTREHLATTDVALAAARRLMLKGSTT